MITVSRVHHGQQAHLHEGAVRCQIQIEIMRLVSVSVDGNNEREKELDVDQRHWLKQMANAPHWSRHSLLAPSDPPATPIAYMVGGLRVPLSFPSPANRL